MDTRCIGGQLLEWMLGTFLDLALQATLRLRMAELGQFLDMKIISKESFFLQLTYFSNSTTLK